MWKPEEFLTASPWGPSPTSGYVYKGLGLAVAIEGSPKGRRPTTWTLTHLGTGHAVCRIDGDVKTAFPIATEIAECGEWDFDSLSGWRDRDPEIPKKVAAIMERHGKRCNRSNGGFQSEETARAIAMARA